MENKKQDLSSGEVLLLIAAILMMSGIGFADTGQTKISKQEIIGMCLSGSGFLIIILMMIYFLYKTYKEK